MRRSASATSSRLRLALLQQGMMASQLLEAEGHRGLAGEEGRRVSPTSLAGKEGHHRGRGRKDGRRRAGKGATSHAIAVLLVNTPPRAGSRHRPASAYQRASFQAKRRRRLLAACWPPGRAGPAAVLTPLRSSASMNFARGAALARGGSRPGA